MESKLEQAARHVARGCKIVAAQKQLIADLREKGADTRQAEYLLGQFKRSLAIFKADLEEQRRKAELPKDR